MKNLAKMLGLTMILGAFLSAAPARAWYDQDGNWHSGGWHRMEESRVFFRDSDRTFLRGYVNQSSVFCPLAGHRRACVQRPQNVVFFQPGSVIPRDVTYTELPESVSARLPAAPQGTIYVRANDNIYLMNRHDRMVIDAINVF
jgi:hypothetical protein